MQAKDVMNIPDSYLVGGVVKGKIDELDKICVKEGKKSEEAFIEYRLTQMEERYPLYEDLIDLMQNLYHESDDYREFILEQTDYVKNECILFSGMGNDRRFDALYYKALLTETPYLFESYIEYLEMKRPYEKRFYEPRRKVLQQVAMDLQELEDNPNAKFYGLSMPSRVGKSTICIFFISWIMLKRPNSHSLMTGHSGELAKGFFKETLTLIEDEEYTYGDMYAYVHPNCVKLREKSAESYTITLDKPDRFATLSCRGADATLTGAIDVSRGGYLYVDDLVRDRQHSLSVKRMEETFQHYLNAMVDRKQVGSKELMVGTLWNVYDPLERMRQQFEGVDGYMFRRIPALDENDESNFDYEINGFTTEYYREMRERLDDAEWQAKYQQKPYMRDGLLFPSDELRYFNGILPDGDHRIVACVDVAWGGGDSLSMPIGAEYENGDVYIFDWIFSRGAKEETIPLVVGRIIDNEIREIRFEGNTGGDMYCAYVDERLREQRYKCSCTSKKAPTRMAKVEKIMAYSGDIKRKFIFIASKRPTLEELDKDAELGITRYVRSNDYQRAMDELGMFVTIGNNDHDDAPDGLTQLAMFVEGGGVAKVEAVHNPFKWGLGR